jgi:lysine 2,3-aminomutase
LPFEEAREKITRGTASLFRERYMAQKEKILAMLGGTDDDWDNWVWQMKNRTDDLDLLAEVLGLSATEREDIRKVAERYRWAITPYYLALINPEDPADPIRRMSVPSVLELDETGLADPMDEEHTNPAGVITRRYPDRLIINVTNACAMFCRHCQRRRGIGGYDSDSNSQAIMESVQYVRDNPEIRDVLITGGDPLTLRNGFMEHLLSELRGIRHVEIIRIGTRTIVTMPQRVDANLIEMLKQFQPIYINTQFNHPQEVTREAVTACNRLANAGIPLGNQMVLLKGVNDDKYVVRVLNHELLKARVRPYYIFHAKQVIGTRHFKTSIDTGIEIMEHLRGHTSGMAIPTYIVNAPKGGGKTPILPQYIINREDGEVRFRTWEGKEFSYPNN